MAKKPAKLSPEQSCKDITLSEWCLDGFMHDPSPEEIKHTIEAIIADGDLLRNSTVSEDAAFSLILRDRNGMRYFKEDDLGMLSMRKRSIIHTVTDNYPELVAFIAEALAPAREKWEKE